MNKINLSLCSAIVFQLSVNCAKSESDLIRIASSIERNNDESHLAAKEYSDFVNKKHYVVGYIVDGMWANEKGIADVSKKETFNKLFEEKKSPNGKIVYLIKNRDKVIFEDQGFNYSKIIDCAINNRCIFNSFDNEKYFAMSDINSNKFWTFNDKCASNTNKRIELSFPKEEESLNAMKVIEPQSLKEEFVIAEEKVRQEIIMSDLIAIKKIQFQLLEGKIFIKEKEGRQEIIMNNLLEIEEIEREKVTKEEACMQAIMINNREAVRKEEEIKHANSIKEKIKVSIKDLVAQEENERIGKSTQLYDAQDALLKRQDKEERILLQKEGQAEEKAREDIERQKELLKEKYNCEMSRIENGEAFSRAFLFKGIELIKDMKKEFDQKKFIVEEVGTRRDIEKEEVESLIKLCLYNARLKKAYKGSHIEKDFSATELLLDLEEIVNSQQPSYLVEFNIFAEAISEYMKKMKKQEETRRKTEDESRFVKLDIEKQNKISLNYVEEKEMLNRGSLNHLEKEDMVNLKRAHQEEKEVLESISKVVYGSNNTKDAIISAQVQVLSLKNTQSLQMQKWLELAEISLKNRLANLNLLLNFPKEENMIKSEIKGSMWKHFNNLNNEKIIEFNALETKEILRACIPNIKEIAYTKNNDINNMVSAQVQLEGVANGGFLKDREVHTFRNSLQSQLNRQQNADIEQSTRQANPNHLNTPY